MRDVPGDSIRLGSVEGAILAELRRTYGAIPRRRLIGVVHAAAATPRASAWFHTPREEHGPALSARERQNAESTLSRALRSLARKGLIVRTINRTERDSFVSLPNAPVPVEWEHVARAEEALAARCDAIAGELAEVARRARTRASRLRTEGKTAPLEVLSGIPSA